MKQEEETDETTVNALGETRKTDSDLPAVLPGQNMKPRRNRIFSKDGRLIYNGVGTISRAALDIIVREAYEEGLENREGPSLLSPTARETESAVRELIEIAGSTGGNMAEVVIERNVSDDEKVRITIDSPQVTPAEERLPQNRVFEIIETINKNASGDNPTVGGYERSIEEGLRLARSFNSENLTINVIPSNREASCEQSVAIFPCRIPAASPHSPGVGTVLQVHRLETEHDSTQIQDGVWRERLDGFSEEFAIENLDVASKSECLMATWSDVHVFFPMERSSAGPGTRVRASLEGFLDTVRSAKRASGRDISVTVHWRSSREEVEL